MIGFDTEHSGHFSINVHETERLVSLVAGSFLLGFGLGKRSIGGTVLAALGASALYRGATGHCPLYPIARPQHQQCGSDAV